MIGHCSSKGACGDENRLESCLFRVGLERQKVNDINATQQFGRISFDRCRHAHEGTPRKKRPPPRTATFRTGETWCVGPRFGEGPGPPGPIGGGFGPLGPLGPGMLMAAQGRSEDERSWKSSQFRVVPGNSINDSDFHWPGPSRSCFSSSSYGSYELWIFWSVAWMSWPKSDVQHAHLTRTLECQQSDKKRDSVARWAKCVDSPPGHISTMLGGKGYIYTSIKSHLILAISFHCWYFCHKQDCVWLRTPFGIAAFTKKNYIFGSNTSLREQRCQYYWYAIQYGCLLLVMIP